MRYWLPLAAAALCLFGVSMVSPIVGYVLVIAALGLVLDACTKWFANAGRTGGLGNHRQ